MSQSDQSKLQPGAKLDKYEIVEQIGAGGTSIVWKGRDPLLGRTVAIKQLLVEADEDDDPFAERFQQEVELHRTLSQKNDRVVELYDHFDRHVDGVREHFLVMEYVEGRTVEQFLTQTGGPLRLAAVLRILYGVAKALHAIHSAGVVHRDLKPSNILYTPDEMVKLCDMGLSVRIAEQEVMDTGSARYMAPELCRGDRADGRADVYALGMIGYEMIVGRDAFATAFRSVLRDRNRQALRWIKWHTNERVTAPPVTEHNPDCPPWLAELVGRMLTKDPTRRLPAMDVQKVIERHLAIAAKTEAHGAGRSGKGKAGAAAGRSSASGPGTDLVKSSSPGSPPAAVPTPTIEISASPELDTAPLPRRRKWPLVVSVLVGLLVVSGVGYAWMVSVERGRELAERRAEARALMQTAGEQYRDGDFADAAASYRLILEQWRDQDDLMRPARAGMLLAEVRLDKDANELEEARRKLLELDELDVVDRDEVYDLLEEIDRRAAFAAQVEEIEASIQDGRFAEARRLIREWRNMTLAEAEEQQLNELRVRLEDQVVQQLVDQAVTQAEALVEAGQRDEAIAHLQTAAAQYNSPRLRGMLQTLDDQRAFDAAVDEAEAQLAAGESAEAVTQFREALRYRDDEAVRERLRRLESRLAVEEGRRLMAAGETARAREALIRALGHAENPEASRILARMDEQERRTAMVQAGDTAMRREDFAAAIAHYQQAMELGEDDSVAEKLTLARASEYVQEGYRLLDAGRMREARRAFETAEALGEAAPGVSEGLQRIQQRTQYMRHLQTGDAYRQESRFVEAKREYRRAREVMDTAEIRQRQDDIEFDHLVAQARMHIEAEQWREAEAMLRVALRLRSEDQAANELLAQVEGERQGEKDR